MSSPPIHASEVLLRRITWGYVLLGCAWLMVSDLLVARSTGLGSGALPVMLAADLAFLLTSATLLHLAVRRGLSMDAPAARSPARPWQRPGTYLLAFVFSAVMVLINDKVGQLVGQRSVLMLSIFPIVFSAYLGGFGPGLVATLVPTLLLDFIAPLSDRLGNLQSSFGLRQLMLISAGVMVSALMGRLHATTRRANQALAELSAASAQLTTLNQDLEKRVATRTAALRSANEELDSFSYAVSHDLRVPVRTMTGMVQVLREDHAEELSDEAQRCLDQIERAAARMSDLIGGLLSLSHDASLPLQDDAVDLSAIAGDILHELALNHSGSPVRFDIEPGIAARGDARLLASVLQNLLGNAWKFTVPQGDAHIVVRSEVRDGQCWLCVEDNGPGFAPEKARALFRPFFREHSSELAPGLGIGLATVRRIVQRHGGLIDCEGRPGQGASFRFTLPTLASQAH